LGGGEGNGSAEGLFKQYLSSQCFRVKTAHGFGRFVPMVMLVERGKTECAPGINQLNAYWSCVVEMHAEITS
jgi:hypothetical protein